MTEATDAQMKKLEPTDSKSLAEYRRVVGTALDVMIGGGLPKAGKLKIHMAPKEVKLADGATVHLSAIGRVGEGDMVPAAGVFKGKFDAGAVVWIHPQGKASLVENGQLVPAAKALVDKGFAIIAPDVFNTGELTGDWSVAVKEGKKTRVVHHSQYPVNKGFAGYTYGYNRPVFANRVHDILTAVAFARDVLKAKTIHLVGWEGAGPWVAAARALCGDAVSRTAIDMNQFRFENVKDVTDENLLPGAVKYGGVPAFLALSAPGEVFAHNHQGTHSGHLSKAAYDAAKASNALKRQPEKAKPEEVIAWLIR